MAYKKNIAIVLWGVHDISGGGGAERFFSDFFARYSSISFSKFNLFLISDDITIKQLRKANRLGNVERGIILFKNFNNRFKYFFEGIQFIFLLFRYRIHLVHLSNYNMYDFDRIYFVRKFYFFKKIKFVSTLVNCMIPHVLNNENNEEFTSYQKRFVLHHNLLNFEGIFTWYESLKNFMVEKNIYKHSPIVQTVSSIYIDTVKFKANFPKDNYFIYAARLESYKNPSWYLESISKILMRNPEIKQNWKFLFYGSGSLNEFIKTLILQLKLEEFVKLEEKSDLSDVFPKTSCFISTQDFENYSSLSMMEAMACGNAIISRNVGQTELLVKHNYNGFLLENDSPEGLADAMLKYINLSESQREQMQKNSIEIINTQHTFEKFKDQIESFWENVLNNHQSR
jgi:glycosyltransferase involved in cell wall biosynthesis